MGDTRDHVITIDEKVKFMKTRMAKRPKLLYDSDGEDSCCMFRVPQSLVEINKEAYMPRIVSIGPYHHGNKDLEMIQEHKWRFLNDLVSRTGKPLKVFLDMMVLMEVRIRQCYSESTDHLNQADLAEMMVLDGVFIIELLLKVKLKIRKDPILRMAWVLPFLMRDLLRLENQIPFFVLQKLFDESKTGTNSQSHPSLQSLIFDFFNYTVTRRKDVLEKYKDLEGKHLLDFFRKSFLKDKKEKESSVEPSIKDQNMNDEEKELSVEPSIKDQNMKVNKGKEEKELSDEPSLKLINPVTKLLIAGVKFRPNPEADSFLDVEFRHGVLLIPHIKIDDFYSSFFLNCVAFEQCYFHCSKDITSYVVFMGRLMNTSIDVGLLSENKIIENYIGTDKEIAKFFNNVGKDVAFDIKSSYLSGLFMDVDKYCKNGWHVGWAGFKHTYFESPWAFISASAAFLLLSLAFLQTFYTVYPYYSK